MQIIPPELQSYSPQRYQSDIEYRQEIDNERIGERHERLLLLFRPHLLPLYDQ